MSRWAVTVASLFILLSGAAAQAPQLGTAALAFGAVGAGATSSPQEVTVANRGSELLTITAWNLSGSGFSLAAADNLPLTLLPGVGTGVSIQFTPSAAQPYVGSFTVATATGSSAAVALSGTGALPQLALTGQGAFGAQPTGLTSGLQVVSLSNPGAIPVTVNSLSITGASFLIYSHTSLPVTLNPGESTGVTLSFTPAAAGVFAGSISASGTASAKLALSGTGTGANPITISAPPLQLTQNQPATATLQASGGTAPYFWSVYWSSPGLPPGLSLSSGGVLTGTPTQTGSFNVIVVVGDNSPWTQWATQIIPINVGEVTADAYGGAAGFACPAGAQAHFYTAEINNRWWLCTPAGNVFWMRGVYNAAADDDGTDYQGIVQINLINAKYATGSTDNATLNWSLQTARRLQSWGFNTLGEYAVGWTLPVGVDSDWNNADDTIPVKLPFIGFEAPSMYSLTNSGGYANQPVKDLMAGVSGAVYSGYRTTAPDIWDPNWQLWLTTALASDPWAQSSIHGPHNDYLVGFNVDDTDYLQGFGAGPDFPTVSNGVVAPGYDQPHLGWLILITAPTQSANASLGQSYSDTTVYTKQAFAQFMAGRYNNSIAALNAAWGAAYSGFGSAGGFGAGTGLLDEDGTCPAARGGACWVPSDGVELSGASAAMQADLDAFLLYYAQHYFSLIKAALNAAAPNVLYLGPTTLGTWGAPPRRQILEAASASVDVLMLPSLPPDCSNCNDQQQRIDFVAQYGGNKPWINWEGYQANADSYMYPYATPSDELKTQAARAALYTSRLQTMLTSADSATGTNHIVGLKWWALYDSRGESANWGLLTPRDDAYDGQADTPSVGVDAWGYPTGCLAGFGCEQTTMGNFLSAVTRANLGIYLQLLGQP